MPPSLLPVAAAPYATVKLRQRARGRFTFLRTILTQALIVSLVDGDPQCNVMLTIMMSHPFG